MIRFPRLLRTLLILFLSSNILVAQSNTVYEFLRNDVGARAASLGGSFITGTDDPNTLFYNPAGLATLSQRRLSLGFFKHLLDINSGYLSAATEIRDLGTVGAGILYVNYGEFKKTGDEGQDLGTFGAGDLAVSAGYGGYLQPDLAYGVAAKFIFSSIEDVYSSAIALDFGLQYVAVPQRMLVGVSLLNLGTQLDPYLTTRESLPLDLRVGVSVYPEHLPAVIMLNFQKLNNRYDSFGDRFRAFSLGVEFEPGPNVNLRVGYDNERRKELKVGTSSGLAGFSVGGGIKTEAYGIDYAFTSLGSIGSMHRISVSF